MITSNLRINQLSDDAYAWYLRYLTALDRKDLDAYGAFLAEDVSLQMNDAPVIQGKATVLKSLAGYWPSFGSIEHDLINLYGTDGSFALEALNHYVRLDGTPVTLRAVAFTDRDESGLVRAVRLYTDTAALFRAS